MPRIEHLGIAVRDAATAADLYERLFGYTPYKRERVEREGVQTVFLDAGGAKLELLEATRDASPIAAYVEKRGEGLHHLAFEVPDIHATMQRLRDRGFRLLNDEPKRGADEKLIFFVHPKSAGGVLVEFCQRSPEPLEPRFAPLRDGQIAYYLGGPDDAPPLVVLHGALGSTELETRRLLPTFQRYFKTIAVDFAAHGASSDFAEEELLTMEFFAEGVPAVLDEVGIERTHVFGFSMGGAVALYHALHHPGRVDRLAVHGINVQWDRGEVAVMTGGMDPESMAGVAPRWAERLGEAHGADRWQPLTRRMIAFTEALPDRPFPNERLARITAPTLVSTGDRDRYFKIEHALNLWRTLPDARLAVHPGLDHPLQHVDPERFAEMMTDFLIGPGVGV
jgi:methylmalonyl-CoA epimerase